MDPIDPPPPEQADAPDASPGALAARAQALLADGEIDRAEALYQALAAMSGAWERVAGWTGLGYVAQARGAHRDAARWLERAAEAADAVGTDPLGAAWTRFAAGSAHHLAGDHGAAIRAYRAALGVIDARAGALDRAGLRVNLGGVLVAGNEHLAAKATLDEALALLPEEARGTALEARLRHNRGLATLALGALDEALVELGAAAELSLALDDPEQAAHSLASRSNVHRYQGDLGRAIADHERVMALEEAHGFVVEEPGGLLYAGIEDHALHLEVARAASAKTAAGGRQLPDADTATDARAPLSHRAELARRPFVIFAPPIPGTWGPLFPRGATTVASYLNHHGVPAVVVPLSHYVDVYLGEEAARARTREVVHDAITSLGPRAIGITATFSYIYPKALEIAAFAREAAPPGTPIIIGGPHVTYQDEQCLAESPDIDVVVRGEGEWTALDLLRTLEAGGDLASVMGITWRAPDGRIVVNRLRPLGNVLELPEVDFGLLPRDFARRMEVSGMTSRGCSFRCRYCHEFRFWGGVVRQYPVARVVGEVERVARDCQNHMQGIDDSMLSMEDAYFVELCERLGRSPWFDPDRFGFLTRIDTVTAEGFEAMRKVGMRALSVGLESGSDAVLLAMNKGVTRERAYAGLELARAHGVAVSGFFIVGHPGDSPFESEVTQRWVEGVFEDELLGWMDAAMFTPYPGTPFFAHPDKYGVKILTRDWSRWRRTNRPVAELEGYPASAIYRSYLRLLQVLDGHRRRIAKAA
ncbi:MAG: radical SAM protein [Deltaproteobacteria bacterium]|nr:radical SAM protein [Deltaproteobacteria bacterium]